MRYDIGQGITQSMLLDWLACRKRAAFRAEGWEPKARKKSFRFGTLTHDLLEYYYTGIQQRRALVPGELETRAQNLARKNLEAAAPGDDPAEIEDEGAVAEALLEGYQKQWADDLEREWVGIESEFDFQWEGFRLRGKRDAVFIDKPKKGPRGLWLLETKTKSQISEDDLDLSLAFDFQSLYYLLTLDGEAKRRGIPLRGCLYNILRKPSLRLKGKESRAEFLGRVEADIEAKPDHYFKRFELTFPQETRDEFAAGLRVQLEEFRRWAAGEAPTYPNPGACLGRYKCEYLEACASGGFAGYAKTREPFPELAKTNPNEKEATDGGATGSAPAGGQGGGAEGVGKGRAPRRKRGHRARA